MATYRVGGEVDAYCTRCKMDLAHTILAMVGTKIVRVRCNTCGGDHAYRGTQPSSSSAPRPSKPRAPSAAAAAREERAILSFQQQLAGKDVAGAPPYSPRDSYAVDQVISHPTFGIGLVTAVRGDKMEVAFKAETKTLVQGRGGAPAQRPAFQRPAEPRSGPADKPQGGGAPARPLASSPEDEQA